MGEWLTCSRSATTVLVLDRGGAIDAPAICSLLIKPSSHSRAKLVTGVRLCVSLRCAQFEGICPNSRKVIAELPPPTSRSFMEFGGSGVPVNSAWESKTL